MVSRLFSEGAGSALLARLLRAAAATRNVKAGSRCMAFPDM
jgi:hypothetical protein